MRLHYLLIIIFAIAANLSKAQEPDELVDFSEVSWSFRFQPDSCSYLPLYLEMENWLGTRYRYAGSNDAGIDCSGLVKALYKTVYNIPLQGGSLSLYQIARKIDPQDLIESDLLFFKTRKNRISHVGLYLRDGYFIHSSRSHGVVISHLGQEYYRRCFAGAGRVK